MGFVNSLKSLKNSCQMLGIDSGLGILNLNSGGNRFSPHDARSLSVVRCVFDGVVDQVADDLSDGSFVGSNSQVTRVTVAAQSDVFEVGGLLMIADTRLHHVH